MPTSPETTTKEMSLLSSSKDTIITILGLPSEWKKMLLQTCIQYREILGISQSTRRLLSAEGSSQRHYQLILLTELLDKGTVDFALLGQQLKENQGEAFDENSYFEACFTIGHYTRDSEFLKRRLLKR